MGIRKCVLRVFYVWKCVNVEMRNVGTVPRFKIYNIGTVSKSKMYNIGILCVFFSSILPSSVPVGSPVPVELRLALSLIITTHPPPLLGK